MNYEGFMRDLISKALQRDTRDLSEDFIGCSEAEIQLVCEKYLVKQLPDAYCAFLRIMGKRCPPLSRSTSMTFPYIMGLDEEVIQCKNDPDFPLCLKNDDFVFGDHDGFIYFYLNLNDGPNPPVYEYLEGFGQGMCTETFTEFLSLEILPS